MKAETFFNNGFGEDCEKVHRNHVIELMQNYAEHYHNEQLRIAVVVPSAFLDVKKAQEQFSIASKKYIESKPHQDMIKALKRVGAF